MAIQAYLKLKSNGSDLEGSSQDTNDHDKWCDVHSFSYGATSPMEAMTARSTGRRQPSPMVILKPLDKASPLLFKALCQNENVEATLELWRDKPDGGMREKYYTIVLKQARVIEVKQYAQPDTQQQNNMGSLEQISIIARESIVTWVDGGIEHSEDWFGRS